MRYKLLHVKLLLSFRFLPPCLAAFRRGGALMPAYRYRTAVVVGRWRSSRRDALADAVKSGFARWDGAPWDKVTWRFPGEIEECGEDPSPADETGTPRAARG